MRFSLLPLAALAVACSSSNGSGQSPSDAGASTDSALVSCQNDARVDTYSAKLAKPSAKGTFKVTLVSADPAPPARDLNTWTVQITDAAGQPLATTPTVETFMPDHGHTSTVKPQLLAQPDGTYQVKNLDFFMGGVWRIRFTVGGGDAGAADTADFFFCVEG